MPLFSDDQDEALKQAERIAADLSAPVRPRADGRAAPQARPVHRAGRRRRAGAGFPRNAERPRHRLHPRLPPPRRRHRARPVRGAGGVRCLGRTLARRTARNRRTRRRGAPPCTRSTRSTFPAIIAWKPPSRRDRGRRLRPVRGTADGARQSVSRSGPNSPPTPSRPAPTISATTERSAAPDHRLRGSAELSDPLMMLSGLETRAPGKT